jgi:hypothetical protein
MAAQELFESEDVGPIRAVKDITAGSVGGIAQVLTGQPFDIVKVPSPHLRVKFSNVRSVCRHSLRQGQGSTPARSTALGK